MSAQVAGTRNIKFSSFIGTTPNGNIQGDVGDWCFVVNAAGTSATVWQKQTTNGDAQNWAQVGGGSTDFSGLPRALSDAEAASLGVGVGKNYINTATSAVSMRQA